MTALLSVVTAVLVLGIGAQILARRLQVPSVLFLILIGVFLGPLGVEVVTLETFGDGLGTVVGLSVAIIIFDGAFQLRREKLLAAPRAIFRLTTVGALLMLIGTTVAVRVFLGTTWSVAGLIGALLIATGPTVITPILEVITVREHVASALEAEGVVNDVTAAILAIVIFETLVLGGQPSLLPVGVLLRVAVGVGVGIAVALAVRAILQNGLDTFDDPPQVARFVVLAGVVAAYGIAEFGATESGIVAAATAGFVLGNSPLPYRDSIHRFDRDLTLIVLSFVFISLAALIDVGLILELGLAGIAVVVAITLLVRPLLVLISTTAQQFTARERVFLGIVGPRGIIPASVATLFAIELELAGQFDAAYTLAGTVFLVIFITVIIQAGFARHIADLLDVIPMPTIIAGGGRVGRALATRLASRGENVVVIEADPTTAEALARRDVRVVRGDATESEVLVEADIDAAKLVVAATGDDDVNLLIAQLARTKFGIDSVYARVNNPDNVDAFDTLGVTAIDVSTALAWSIDNEIERPALAHWMNVLGEGHDVQEIDVTAEDLVNRTIREVNAAIPDGCIVAVIGRDGQTHVPGAEEELQLGDRITFIGETSAVERATKRFHPHD